MIHSFNLNNEEEKKFQEIVSREKNKSESAIIRQRLFRRRERNRIKLDVVDIKFLSVISNIVSSMKDSYSRGKGIDEELEELKEIVDNKLNEA